MHVCTHENTHEHTFMAEGIKPNEITLRLEQSPFSKYHLRNPFLSSENSLLTKMCLNAVSHEKE